MKTIGIDIGTTTISAAVIDAGNHRVIQTKTVKNGSFLDTEHAWERIQDVSLIVKKASALLDELLDDYSDTASIGLTGQMHGILYLNREGRHVSPLYTWQDGRGNLPVFDGKTLCTMVYETSGVKLSTGYGLATHLYNLKQNLVPQDSVSVCTIADYVGMVLTGRRKPLIHVSNAASLGFFDSAHSVFLEKELRVAGADASILPEVTDQISVLGEYRGIPVTVAIGDNQASFLGSVGLKSDALLLNMGTGGQISVLSDQYFEAPGIEARPLVKGKYLLVGSSLCGGRAYAILEQFFRSYVQAVYGAAGEQYDVAEQRCASASCNAMENLDEQYSVMERLAEQGAILKDRPHAVTAFNGTRENPQLRGSITNISEENFTPAGLVYSVLEGMARELYEMYDQIRQGTGIRVSHLVASGNGIRKNRILQQICSQMFGADLELAACEEEAACGAAYATVHSVTSSGLFHHF